MNSTGFSGRFLFWMLSFEKTVGIGKVKRENPLMVYLELRKGVLLHLSIKMCCVVTLGSGLRNKC